MPHRLMYCSTNDGGPVWSYTDWLRAQGEIDALIALAEEETSGNGGYCIEDAAGHLIYEPSLGRETVQDERPGDWASPEWWQDEAGLWHQQPC